MKLHLSLLTVALGLLLAQCGSGPKSGRGFRLPDGDVERGKAAFLALKCYRCHTVDGVELPKPEEMPPIMVALGGEVVRVETYGELVTSIIHPSHRLAKGYPMDRIQSGGYSKMTNFNHQMTVRQMIDLVAFLQSHYTKIFRLPPRPRPSFSRSDPDSVERSFPSSDPG